MSTAGIKPEVINTSSTSRTSLRVTKKTEEHTKFKQDTIRIPRITEYTIPRKLQDPIVFPPALDYHQYVFEALEEVEKVGNMLGKIKDLKYVDHDLSD